MYRAVYASVALLVPAALLAQDTWLIPAAFRTPARQAVQLRLATGTPFPESEAAVTPDQIARFTLRSSSGARPVEGYCVDGKFLVAEVIAPEEGHTIVAAETTPRVLARDPKAFYDYLREEELNPILMARKEKGQRNSPGRERYRKIAKTILCVGQASDRNYRKPEGLWLEIMPEESTCRLRVGGALTLRVLFEGQPLPRVVVAAGYQGVTGHHYPIWVRSDKNGRVRIPFDRPGTWFVRTLHMVAARGDPEADWHSAISTLTFEVLK